MSQHKEGGRPVGGKKAQTGTPATPASGTTGSGRPSPTGAARGGGRQLSAGSGTSSVVGAGQGSRALPAAAAGELAASKVEGNKGSHTRRYAGRAVSGAVRGGASGGAHGAAAGAAKEAASEAGRDMIKGAKRATGGSPSTKPADERLGAGGTSYQRGSQREDSTSGKGGRTIAAGAALAAAPPAVTLIGLIVFFAWLKSMFLQLISVLLNWLALLWAWAKALAGMAFGVVAGPLLTLGYGVVGGLNALGAGISAAAAPFVAIGTAVASAGGIVGFGFGVGQHMVDQMEQSRQGKVDQVAECTTTDSGGGGSDSVEVAPGEVSADAEESAKTVYAVLSSWDMPDENIAGILGNWSRESGVDPTSVEGIFTEPYQIGSRKKQAWDGNFTHIPGQSHGGIGLGQWSNDRTPMLLDYAKAKGVKWYTIETQLAFMADEKGDNPSDVEVFKDLIATSQGSPGEAALHFHHNWERSADEADGLGARQADAKMWMGKISGWDAGEADLSEIEDVIGNVVTASESGLAPAAAQCEDEDGGAGGGGAAGAFDDRDGKTKPGKWGGHDNGKIPEKKLSELTWAPGETLRDDAAKDFEKLNKAYKKKFGNDMSVTDTYRSYDEQVELKGKRGKWAATPGTSNHGWGMAVDLGDGVENFGTPEHKWLKANAEKYGWHHPDWAEPGGSLPEPWHWEYWGYEK